MAKQKRLLRGLDNFKDLINRNGYFVDKTLLIQEVLDDPHSVILLPRPRRFGKSLNLSMLANFFDINQTDNAKLFKPYQIWKAGKKYTEEQGKYPVIHFSLKEVRESSYENCIECLIDVIGDLYAAKEYLLKSEYLSSRDKLQFQQILSGGASKILYQRSLKKLSAYLHQHHQEKVIILIDEYDTPIHTGYRNGYYAEIIKFMKSFLGAALKTNTALYRGVITGILRVSKESIFSGVNNIEVYTVVKKRYADKFGFTEQETKDLLQHFQLAKDFDLIKKWYDGYRIGHIEDIYNPWSVTGYISAPNEGFRTHWVNTSSDELIKERIIEKNATEIRTDIEALLMGKTLNKVIEEQMVFGDFSRKKELLWSLLLYAGYLTTAHQVSPRFYHLKIPNYEIKTLFQGIIWHWLEVGMNITSSLLKKMIDSLTENRIKDFEKHFQVVMGDTFSYFDVTKNPEDVWQAYVLGLLAISEEDYIIRSNRESGIGRYDILMLPKTKTKYGIVIEIKAMDKDATKTQIDAKLKEALGQIQKNEYYQELIAHDVPKRIEIAMVFAGKKVYMLPKN